MKSTRNITVLLIIAMAIFFTSCSAKSDSIAEGNYLDSGYFPQETSGENIEKNLAEELSPQSDGSTPSGSENPNQKLVYTASLTIESSEFEKAVSDMNALIEDCNGYISSSNKVGVQASNAGMAGMRSISLTVRIPSDKFDDFLNNSERVGNILAQKTNVDDISDKYYDSEAHLKTLKVKEERLLDLLGKTTNLSSVIELEKALSDTRYEIEKLTGTLRKWDGQIQYSTFTVKINEVTEITPMSAPPKTVGERIKSRFNSSIGSIKNAGTSFIVWLIGDLPLIVCWGAILLIIILTILRVLKRNRARKSALYNSKSFEKEKDPEDT